MTSTEFGERGNDSRAHGSVGDGHPRRTFLKGVGLLGVGAVVGPSLASLAGATSGPAIPSPTTTVCSLPVGSEFESTYGGTDNDVFTAVLDCDAARPASVTVTNVSDAAYELRDIDSAGIDALTGRPVLEPGETYTMDDLPNGTAVFRAFEPGTNRGVGPRLRVEIDCSGFESQPLEVSVCGGRVDITNVGNRTVQVRDLDGKGGDLITGRPRLDPDEVLTKRDVAPETYYVQAWDGDENASIAPPVEVVVEDDEAFFDVDYVATGSSTTAGDEYEVDVGITNTGTGDGTRCIDLRFDDETVATEEVELDASESTEIRFVIPGDRTIEFEPNRSYTVTADTGDDTGSTEKYVLPPA